MRCDGKAVCGLRIEVTSFAGPETDVGAEDDSVLDSDGDSDSNVGAKPLGSELGGRERDVPSVDEAVEPVLSDGAALDPDVGDRLIEVDLGEEAIRRAEAVVDETTKGVNAFEIGAAEGGLEIERDGTRG